MPPSSGVIAISAMASVVKSTSIHCGSIHRMARPPSSEPKPLVSSTAANRMPIMVPVRPISSM